MLSYKLTKFKTVNLREHHIQNYKVIRITKSSLLAGFSVMAQLHLKT